MHELHLTENLRSSEKEDRRGIDLTETTEDCRMLQPGSFIINIPGHVFSG